MLVYDFFFCFCDSRDEFQYIASRHLLNISPSYYFICSQPIGNKWFSTVTESSIANFRRLHNNPDFLLDKEWVFITLIGSFLPMYIYTEINTVYSILIFLEWDRGSAAELEKSMLMLIFCVYVCCLLKQCDWKIFQGWTFCSLFGQRNQPTSHPTLYEPLCLCSWLCVSCLHKFTIN